MPSGDTPVEEIARIPMPGSSTAGASTEGATGVLAVPVAAGAAAEKPSTEESSTRADLRLLRTESGLRARCAAGVLVPFLLYTVILAVISRTDVYLIWVWIPTVTAGVLVGSLLDIAHGKARQQGTNQSGVDR
ncbi:MAG: hypothetical protein ABI232_13110 [Jatrophihabitantaceae bacterium]